MNDHTIPAQPRDRSSRDRSWVTDVGQSVTHTSTITVGWTKHDGPRDQQTYTPYRDSWIPGQPQHVETITLDLPDVLDHPVGITGLTLAEAVYEATNAPEVREDSLAGRILTALQATGYRGEEAHWSLAVGDAVTVDGTVYAVERSGWKVAGVVSRHNQHEVIARGGREPSEAEVLGRVTGSTEATVIHDHVDPATGEVVTDSVQTWTKEAGR